MTHWVVPIFRSKVEVVHRQRLLIERRVRALGESQHDGVHVAHIVAAHDVGAVCETSRPETLVSRRSTKVFVKRVTLGKRSAGSTQSVWASDLASTRHG